MNRFSIFPQGIPNESYSVNSILVSRTSLAIMRVAALTYMSTSSMAFLYVRRWSNGSIFDYFQYFTHWTWVLLVAYYILTYTGYACLWSTGSVPPFLRVATHVVFDTVAPFTPFVVAGGWVGMVPGVRELGPVFGLYSFSEHGINMALCLVEICVSMHRFHYSHLIFPTTYGVCYMVFYKSRCEVTGMHAYAQLTCDRAWYAIILGILFMASTFVVMKWIRECAEREMSEQCVEQEGPGADSRIRVDGVCKPLL